MENNSFFDELEKIDTNNKVRCVNCGKEVKDLKKGCTYCNGLKDYSTINDNSKISTIKKENNTISVILKVIAWIIFILGFIMGFILGVDEYENLYFPHMLEIWCLYGVGFLVTYAFAEIIQILHDIRLKVWK